jgi:hypothetical protein
MSTSFDREVALTLNDLMPRAEAWAIATGRPLDRKEFTKLIRESHAGNLESLEKSRAYLPPVAPAKPATPAINEATDLGRALLETAGRRSPFFAETGPRTVKDITESAGTFSPEVSKLSDQLPSFKRDDIFNAAMVDFARTVPFGSRRLDS